MASDRPDGRLCPRCGKSDTERVALYGSQLMTSQFHCRACGALFEAVRWLEDEDPA